MSDRNYRYDGGYGNDDGYREEDERLAAALARVFMSVVLGLLLVVGFVVACSGCDGRKLRRENEELRSLLARQQRYVPLERDTIRDTVEVVRQVVVEVERPGDVLTDGERQLVRDLGVRVAALEQVQTTGMVTAGSVTLEGDGGGRDDGGSEAAGDSPADSKSAQGDSILSYQDAWAEFRYNTNNRVLAYSMRDSLVIAVEREYRHRFLWWRWGVKGYGVKAVSLNPHATIKYNTFVKKKRK